MELGKTFSCRVRLRRRGAGATGLTYFRLGNEPIVPTGTELSQRGRCRQDDVLQRVLSSKVCVGAGDII